MKLQLDFLPNYPEIKLYQDKDMICINTDTMVLGEFLEELILSLVDLKYGGLQTITSTWSPT